MARKSSIIADLNACMVCGKRAEHMHHVFGGAYRQKSDIYKLIVPLCAECHTGAHGVHNNRELDLQLKQFAQKRFEDIYGLSFFKVFGKNYL